ncbi:MAG: hypothetical protein KCHDKBKB_02983 [Elusimicrobia bacterium]|nr:hypothetical protein [Elusimicrobiota bacterium]
MDYLNGDDNGNRANSEKSLADMLDSLEGPEDSGSAHAILGEAETDKPKRRGRPRKPKSETGDSNELAQLLANTFVMTLDAIVRAFAVQPLTDFDKVSLTNATKLLLVKYKDAMVYGPELVFAIAILSIGAPRVIEYANNRKAQKALNNGA